MAATTHAPMPIDEAPGPLLWNVETYERLVDSGQLDHIRTELIEGRIYVKWTRGAAEGDMGQGNAHITAIRLVIAALRKGLGDGFDVNAQLPLPLDRHNAPEPDVLVLRGAATDYDGRNPDPVRDVALLVEISETSLPYDQSVKAGLYARHGVAEYWIVNLQNRTLEVRRRPNRELGEYDQLTVVREGETVPVGSGEIAVTDLLPKNVPAEG
jgi:Uma2 family endonuclease